MAQGIRPRSYSLPNNPTLEKPEARKRSLSLPEPPFINPSSKDGLATRPLSARQVTRLTYSKDLADCIAVISLTTLIILLGIAFIGGLYFPLPIVIGIAIAAVIFIISANTSSSIQKAISLSQGKIPQEERSPPRQERIRSGSASYSWFWMAEILGAIFLLIS